MAVSFVLVPAPVDAAVTATSTTLPGSFGAMVVDATTGHVFVSLPDTSKVVVLDFSGNILATISGQSGAQGMALSGGFLYVVDATAGSISQINTSSLAVTTLTSGLPGMKDIVAAAGSLWVISRSGATASLVSVSTTDGTQTPFTNPGGYYGIGLYGSPTDTNTLIENTPEATPDTFTRALICRRTRPAQSRALTSSRSASRSPPTSRLRPTVNTSCPPARRRRTSSS